MALESLHLHAGTQREGRVVGGGGALKNTHTKSDQEGKEKKRKYFLPSTKNLKKKASTSCEMQRDASFFIKQAAAKKRGRRSLDGRSSVMLDLSSSLAFQILHTPAVKKERGRERVSRFFRILEDFGVFGYQNSKQKHRRFCPTNNALLN